MYEELRPLETTPEIDKMITLSYNNTTNTYTFKRKIQSSHVATIWQITCDKSKYALKTFNEKYIIAVRSQHYDLSGVWTQIKNLVKDIPAFNWVESSYCPTNSDPYDNDYCMSIMMPWLEGSTLGALIAKLEDDPQLLNECNLNQIAELFISSLAKLEEKNIAHIDICSGNVLIDIKNPHEPKIHIIDIEELYYTELTQPPAVNMSELQRGNQDCHGQMGYRFPGIGFGANYGWCNHADRYSAAILLSQILTLNNETVRKNYANEQSYFEATYNMNNEDRERQKLLVDTLEKQGYTCLSKYISEILNSTNETRIDGLPTLTQLADTLKFDITHIKNPSVDSAQPKNNLATVMTLPHIDTLSSNQLNSADGRYDSEKLTPYKTFATSKNPVLFVFVIDISQSMYEHQGIDNALSLCNKILSALLSQSWLSDVISPRYHLALFCYHSHAINVFDTIEKDNPGTLKDIGVKPKSRIPEDYPSIITIDQLEELKFSLDMIKKIRPREISAKYAQTNYSSVFNDVYNFMRQHIQKYNASHPPYVFHITDGNMTDLDIDDLLKQSRNIQELSTKYGNVLVSNLLVGHNVNRTTSTTMVKSIQDLSSPMPNHYVEITPSLKGSCMFVNPIIDILQKYIVTTSITGSRK